MSQISTLDTSITSKKQEFTWGKLSPWIEILALSICGLLLLNQNQHTPQPLLPDYQPSEIINLTISRGTEILSFSRTDSTSAWKFSSGEAARTDFIEALLNSIARATISPRPTKLSYDSLDFSHPILLTIRSPKQTWNITVGPYNEFLKLYYAALEDKDKIILINAPFVNFALKPLSDFNNAPLIPAEKSQTNEPTAELLE